MATHFEKLAGKIIWIFNILSTYLWLIASREGFIGLSFFLIGFIFSFLGVSCCIILGSKPQRSLEREMSISFPWSKHWAPICNILISLVVPMLIWMVPVIFLFDSSIWLFFNVGTSLGETEFSGGEMVRGNLLFLRGMVWLRSPCWLWRNSNILSSYYKTFQYSSLFGRWGLYKDCKINSRLSGRICCEIIEA